MNGWKNFETWYVWAHYVSDQSEHWEEMMGMYDDDGEDNCAYHLGQAMKEQLSELIQEQCLNSVATDLAEIVLDKCAWYDMGKVVVRDKWNEDED